MQDSRKIKAKLVYPYSSTPSNSYQKLMEASTMLYPYRKNYVHQRMINSVKGKQNKRDYD